MKNDEFFNKVDTKLKKGKAADPAAQEIASQNRGFIEQTVARLTPVAVAYQAKLKERGINSKLDKSDTSITITLQYKDGARDQVYLGGFPSSGLIELNTLYTEGTQTYAATKSYNSGRWQDDFFELRLQSLIDIFLLHADKHGGL